MKINYFHCSELDGQKNNEKDCFIAAVARYSVRAFGVCRLSHRWWENVLWRRCAGVGLRTQTGVNHKMIWRFLWMMRMFNNISYFNAHELRAKINAWRCMAGARLIYQENTTWMWHNVNANRFFNLRIVVWGDGAMPTTLRFTEPHSFNVPRSGDHINDIDLGRFVSSWSRHAEYSRQCASGAKPMTKLYMLFADEKTLQPICRRRRRRRLNTTISMRSHFVPHRFAFFSLHIFILTMEVLLARRRAAIFASRKKIIRRGCGDKCDVFNENDPMTWCWMISSFMIAVLLSEQQQQQQQLKIIQPK